MAEQKTLSMSSPVSIALMIVILGSAAKLIDWSSGALRTSTRNEQAIVVLQREFKEFNDEVIDRLARIETLITK